MANVPCYNRLPPFALAYLGRGWPPLRIAAPHQPPGCLWEGSADISGGLQSPILLSMPHYVPPGRHTCREPPKTPSTPPNLHVAPPIANLQNPRGLCLHVSIPNRTPSDLHTPIPLCRSTYSASRRTELHTSISLYLQCASRAVGL